MPSDYPGIKCVWLQSFFVCCTIQPARSLCIYRRQCQRICRCCIRINRTIHEPDCFSWMQPDLQHMGCSCIWCQAYSHSNNWHTYWEISPAAFSPSNLWGPARTQGDSSLTNLIHHLKCNTCLAVCWFVQDTARDTIKSFAKSKPTTSTSFPLSARWVTWS